LFGKSFQGTPIVCQSKKLIRLKQFSGEYIELQKLSISNAYIEQSVIPSFKHLLIYFGNVKLQNISPQKAEIFILEHFQKAKYGASLYHRVLKAAFRKALTWKYIDSNPFSQIKLPKIQHKSPIFLTVDELKIILDNTDKKVLRDIFMFAFLTGLRLAEVVNLT
jgi:integrase